MDKLDPVRALLSVIAEAVHVCQKNRNVPREWMAEAEFCSRLRATLGSVKDCSPIKGNFPHAQELNHLIQVVLQTLNYFYNDLVPGLPSLQKGCAPGASPALLSQLEGQLGGSVIPRTKALREQADRYLQGIDTLLLLYVMYADSGDRTVFGQALTATPEMLSAVSRMSCFRRNAFMTCTTSHGEPRSEPRKALIN